MTVAEYSVNRPVPVIAAAAGGLEGGQRAGAPLKYGTRLGIGHTVEWTTWLGFTPDERRALEQHDYTALFELGAHFFLCLTIFIAIYDEDYAATGGPLSFQREYAKKLSHWLGKDYPPVAL